MRQDFLFSVLLGLMCLSFGCSSDQSRTDAKPNPLVAKHPEAAARREIIAQHVLGAQLAPHHEFEARTTFAPTEPIPASLYLAHPVYTESRRILAFLVSDEAVVEEQSVALSASDARQEFDFHFAKTPRPAGSYQIRFMEITRSNAKPVLLARLFLNVE